jgi:hypothetical protein
MKRVLARAELQPKWLVYGQPQHAQRHVERPENDCRPCHTDFVATPTQHADGQQRNAPHYVQQVVAPVSGIDRRLDTERVNQQEYGAIQQQTGAQHPDIQLDKAHRIDELELRPQEAHAPATD